MLTKITELKLLENNPRKGSLEIIKESLSNHGQFKPIVVRAETREVLAGNHTLKAAQELGWTEIDAHFLEDLTDEQAAKIVLIDNKATDDSSYDNKTLVEMLGQLETLTGSGWNANELAELLALVEERQKAPKEEVEHTANTVTEGQLWGVGQHRLYVGSSTEETSLQRLLGERYGSVDLLLTDPPYNIAYEGSTEEALTIKNDKMSDSEFYTFLHNAYKVANDAMKPGAAAYSFYANTESVNFYRAFQDAGFYLAQQLIWMKNSPTFGRADYKNQYEPCLYGWKSGAAHYWANNQKQRTIIEELGGKEVASLTKAELVELANNLLATDIVKFNRPSANKLHPTMKPLELMEYLIENSTRHGEAVLDTFSGSASTLVAAHNVNRVGYGIELDAFYAERSLERLEDVVGVSAELLGDWS